MNILVSGEEFALKKWVLEIPSNTYIKSIRQIFGEQVPSK